MAGRAKWPAMADLQKLHDRFAKSSVRMIKSRLDPKRSVHEVGNRAALSSLVALQKIARAERLGEHTVIGSLGGNIVVTVSAQREPAQQTSSKKRKADTEREEAARTVDRVKRAQNKTDFKSVTKATFCIATDVLCSLLKLRGVSGQSVVESFAVSIRNPGEFGNESSSGIQSLVIGMRLAPGVPLSMSQLLTAVESCPDGLLTTSTELMGDFRLPLSEHAKAAVECGQKALSILLAVPRVEDVG